MLGLQSVTAIRTKQESVFLGSVRSKFKCISAKRLKNTAVVLYPHTARDVLENLAIRAFIRDHNAMIYAISFVLASGHKSPNNDLLVFR